MSIKYITDLHIKGYDFIDIPIMEKVLSIVEKDDILVVGGDVFDTYQIGLSNTVFYDYMLKISDICKSVYILTGNHDINQGVCSFRLFKYAKNNVKVIEDFYKETIDGVNYYFLNHFRHYPEFSKIKLEGVNILFSHAEINNSLEIPKKFRLFDRVYNGHIHDYSYFDNVVNTGAFRQTKKNESNTRYYLEIKGASFEKFDFLTPVKVYEVNYNDLSSVVDEASIVKVIINNQFERETFKELQKNFKNILFRTESYNDPDIVINKSKELIKQDFNIYKIFEDYYEEFEKKFNTKYDKIKLCNLFKKSIGNVKDLNYISFNIKRLVLNNFKLFKELDFLFDKKGLVLIKGVNNDEVSLNNIPSNEAGKTVIRQAIEYAFLGSDAKISPLRNNEKKGSVELYFKLNGDDICFKREFTGKSNDLYIFVNDKEYNKDMTMTEKLMKFDEEYKIRGYISYILLYNRDWVGSFFNPKSNQKFNILTEMFPHLLSLADDLNKKIQSTIKELESSYKSELQAYESILMMRKNIAKSYLYSIKNAKNTLLNDKNTLLKYKKELDGLEKPEEPHYTLEYLNKISMYADIVKPESPYNYQKPVDVNDALLKINQYNEYIRLKEISDNLKDNIKYLDDYLNNTLVKDTTSIEKQISILNAKITSLREDYLKEIDNLNKSKKCYVCGSDLTGEQAEEIRVKIKDSLNRIKDSGISLAEELKDKELELSNIKEFNAKNKQIFDTFVVYNKNDLIKIREGISKPDGDIEEYLWIKENGNKFNYNLKLYNEKIELNIPDGIDVEKEMELLSKRNTYITKKGSLNSIISDLESRINYTINNYKQLLQSVKIDNDKTRLNLKENKHKIILEDLTSYKEFGEVLYAKKTLNFNNYFVSVFLHKIESVISSFLSVLFTRGVELKVNDFDFIFIDEEMERTYFDFSKGAKTKIDIALVLALTLIQFEYGFKTNFIFIDEFLDDGVDETNIQRIIELLRKCFNDIDNLFLVSHRNIEEIVDNVLYVIRNNGVSNCSY